MEVLEKKEKKYNQNIGVNIISTLGVSCNSKLRVGVRHWTPLVCECRIRCLDLKKEGAGFHEL